MYLDIIGRELENRMGEDILEHLESLVESDYELIQQLQADMDKCPDCEKPLCNNCGVCHPCENSEHPSPSKKPEEMN